MMHVLRSLRKQKNSAEGYAPETSGTDNDRYHQFRVSTLRGIITGAAICWMAAGVFVLFLMSTPFFAAESKSTLIQEAGGTGMYFLWRMAIEMQYIAIMILPYVALWLAGLAIRHQPYTHHIQKLAAIQLVLHFACAIAFVVIIAL